MYLKVVIADPTILSPNRERDVWYRESELHISTEGVLVVKCYGRPVAAYSNGQWKTAESRQSIPAHIKCERI